MIKGKVYIDKKNGVHAKVVEVDSTIAIMEDGNRIAVERLLDTNYYSEANAKFTVNENFNTNTNTNMNMNMNMNMNNPMDFFDNPNRYNSILNKISTINPHDIDDNLPEDMKHRTSIKMDDSVFNNSVSTNNNNYNTNIETSTYQMSDQEERQALIDRTMREQQELRDKMSGQALALGEYIDETEIDPNLTTDKYLVDLHQKHIDEMSNENINNVTSSTFVKANIKPQVKEDPMIKMFNSMKKTDKFNISIKIEELIPNKTFIKMWQEASDISIIDYLTDDMYNKLMRNPEVIKEQIKDKLNNIINKKKPESKDE